MVEIRFARPDEREDVVQFMHQSFPRAKWSIDGWRKLLSGRWAQEDDPFAVVVRDQGRMIGVLGLVMSRRQMDFGTARLCNLTSWYVDKAYRGQGIGQRVMQLVTADPALTCTNLSSARGALGVVANVGLQVLDDTRFIWERSGPSRLLVHDDLDGTEGVLSEQEQQILKDHADLKLCPLVIETSGGPCFMMISVQQKVDAYITHEVMYLGDRALFARYAREIADAVLPEGHAAVLSVDSRFVAEGVVPDRTEPIPVPRFYSPGNLSPEAIDHLYTEIVLLGMKLY
ncbi:GNAT family N-acetyltransferase [Sulfitobacter mediterraneus]|uniref:GNAT family N-acetyltransferase n=1 Tax=Sulfitobacter mediterraneus TaxID=83219 RepID=UPI0019316026|nr:GNAT family N-acetyltransferase [Sulfitobacter mediterraneus]MBM1634293.1 GNAT family N-acetyltransferase [Sulfitobacter mediterraneus]MBM1642110.1 GNAT family N-acetyltransferase [Sulfitobacter mediterraneus]MBM1646159.1 GNAT family N-acetyltransferase [Sulfitobacter mediterraneus]MBM1650205.1 GNAT family N-acetyltransferase [Sulfitobacter mediterraneus]MBM1654227.1 GNAT family N-acetyltransferase [Sulfitobacter mediterraneus]